MRYFQPKSLTWWMGILSVLLGVAGILFPETELIRNLMGVASQINELGVPAGSSPAVYIIAGLGLIGLRDKMERNSVEVKQVVTNTVAAGLARATAEAMTAAVAKSQSRKPPARRDGQ